MLNLFIFDRFDDSTKAFAFAKAVEGTVYLPELHGGAFPGDLTPPIVYIEVEADGVADEHPSTSLVEEYSGRFAYVMAGVPKEPGRPSRL